MKERPILFSAPMIRALLAGTKTQTRRIVKPQPFKPDPSRPSYFPFQPEDWVWSANSWSSTISNSPEGPAGWAKHSPYGQPGDRLWVRETFITGCEMDENGYFTVDENGSYVDKIWYRASDPELDWWREDGEICHPPWKPSIHMPRSASRLTLEITGVRVERLQDISEADAIAEGVERVGDRFKQYMPMFDGSAYEPALAKSSYSQLWESINGPNAWNANPWVWVVEFKRVR